jgi:hypothetical protein
MVFEDLFGIILFFSRFAHFSLMVSLGRRKVWVCCRHPRSICPLSIVLLRYPVICRLESLPYGGLPSAIRGLNSLIRSPFVDGSPYRSPETLLPDRMSLMQYALKQNCDAIGY